MIDLRPATAAPAPCKICGGAAAPFGSLDFNKGCETPHARRLPPAGVAVMYRRCGACGFVFTDAFDDWHADDFKAHIYNDDYLGVDPDYVSVRPSANAGAVRELFGASKSEIRLLDYGGGNGAMCAELRAAGFPVALTYDPFVAAHAQRPEGKFNLVTCFETLEHMPDPVGGIADLVSCIADPGLLLFSTLVQPQDFDRVGLGWWYAAPRNGHISLFSRKAIALAFERHGYRAISLTDNAHLAFRTLPDFARRRLVK
ncbi:MAG TPA: class I SAM-dependent methyltransferase [Pseudolabrys sp.]|jgi:2-polyprenyl-6-hydroxyphenyl methylase/3-demethylubiquinone-9 3-methyltransferase|nr:class I SAM-dependent methyltransferase [Pseudolabrys sp.]